MRHALALIAFALALAACAAAPSGQTYELTVLEVRGADLYASIEDYGLSRADCLAAIKGRDMVVCEPERRA